MTNGRLVIVIFKHRSGARNDMAARTAQGNRKSVEPEFTPSTQTVKIVFALPARSKPTRPANPFQTEISGITRNTGANAIVSIADGSACGPAEHHM